MARKRKVRVVQRELYRSRGGRRKGAGRKPKGPRPRVPHRARGPHAARYPVHVTLRIEDGLPSLRGRLAFLVVKGALADGCEKSGYRVVEYSVQGNHLHLLCEASCRERLVRGMQGLAVRIAKRLNRLWIRRGRVFADRYHERVLRTPREVRSALVYVLANARKHGVALSEWIDRCSSACWFGGFRDRRPDVGSPLPGARTWLLGMGWRRVGLLLQADSPAGAP
jgi:REP element-mobilizing transposase RayT